MASQQQQINAAKNQNRAHKLWTNPLLERLSLRLATRSVEIGQVGFGSKTACPSSYAYDTMLPLAHAGEEEPLGWVLFGAKYMHNAMLQATLRKHVLEELPHHGCIEDFADLVVACVCVGRPISEREIRRVLKVGRGNGLVFHQAKERILDHLAQVEDNYARLVKKYL